jgi:hypothetical protein
MKSQKIAGIRLINYLNDGVNWKDHKDIVLDFWISAKSRDAGFNPKQFDKMFYVSELPTNVQEIYEEWFNTYDFNTTEDGDWIDFVSKTLNIFYHTSDPTMLPDDTWYVILMQSELKAREICENQLFHGSPNINTFWKIDTNSKTEEVGGRRNGYLYSNQLENISNGDTKGYYWAVMYQCPETVKLFYLDGDDRKSRCINWAADCKNMTLLKITNSGRFVVIPIDVEGKSWKPDKTIPAGSDIRQKAFTGHSLAQYVSRNYYDMYGRTEEFEEQVKAEREAINQRKNAMNTMNDESVDVGKVIDVDEFIIDGNVSDQERERNKLIRKRIIKRNQIRDREVKKKMREMEKNSGKRDRRDRNKLNPFLSKK